MSFLSTKDVIIVFELEEGHFWYPNLDLDLTQFKKPNYRTTLHWMCYIICNTDCMQKDYKEEASTKLHFAKLGFYESERTSRNFVDSLVPFYQLL